MITVMVVLVTIMTSDKHVLYHRYHVMNPANFPFKAHRTPLREVEKELDQVSIYRK